jgi:hypothetical protein
MHEQVETTKEPKEEDKAPQLLDLLEKNFKIQQLEEPLSLITFQSPR